MKILASCLMVLLLGCSPSSETLRGAPAELSVIRSAGERGFSVGDVVKWAQLDDHFRDSTIRLEVGLADGKAPLGRLVTLENGAEAAEFLKAHGCAQVSGPKGVRRLRTALEVEVEITGKDGMKLMIVLKSDGTPAGEG